MKFIALALTLFFAGFIATEARAQRPEIVDVISRQLDAFQRDDADGAFAFASPSIQATFGSSKNFMAMVRQSYLPVFRARAVTYLDLLRRDRGYVQRVLFTGGNGDQVVVLYTMERQADGSWRIGGVLLAAVPGPST